MSNTANAIIKPIKGKLDKREYESFTLDNGLKCVVVRDEEVALAAASLMMPVGSHEDGDLPGLAHFLEHMYKII